MILPDVTIREEIEMGRILIEPYNADLVQAASLDICMGDEVMTALPGATKPVIVPNDKLVDDSLHFHRVVCDGDPHPEEFHLYPDQLTLVPSMEHIQLPNDVAARIEGKTSLARFGILTCPTAGFIAPGYHGRVTIELFNLTNRPIELKVGMPIAQLVFYRLEQPCERPYGTTGKSGQNLRDLRRLGLI